MLKKRILISLFLVLAIPLTYTYAASEYSFKVRMIKANKQKRDLVVEKPDGERWLIQYKQICNSMNTESLLTWVVKNHAYKKDQIKVAFNEICDIHYATPYSGEGELTELIKSNNLKIKDHLARINWNNRSHLIDYTSNRQCRHLHQFLGEVVYFSMENSQKGIMVLPGGLGKCNFTILESDGEPLINPEELNEIKGLDYQAQTNQVYLYWEKDKSREKPLYALSYSRQKVNPNDFTNWRQMPNARYVLENSITVKHLANEVDYNFYITTLDEDLKPGKWAHVKIAPVAPEKITLIYHNDLEVFTVDMKETEEEYVLSWPEDENAKRYFIRFYINGRQEYFKILKTDFREWRIPKREEYLNKGLRFTVRSVPKSPFLPREKDGIYWETYEK